jgi:hypothetical protein
LLGCPCRADLRGKPWRVTGQHRPARDGLGVTVARGGSHDASPASQFPVQRDRIRPCWNRTVSRHCRYRPSRRSLASRTRLPIEISWTGAGGSLQSSHASHAREQGGHIGDDPAGMDSTVSPCETAITGHLP